MNSGRFTKLPSYSIGALCAPEPAFLLESPHEQRQIH